MRELFPVIRKQYKTVREGDIIKVNVNGFWYHAKVTGVVRNLIVITGVTKRIPKNYVPDDRPFKRVTDPKDIKNYRKYPTPAYSSRWDYSYWSSNGNNNNDTPAPSEPEFVPKNSKWRKQFRSVPAPVPVIDDVPKAGRDRSKKEPFVYGYAKENKYHFRDQNGEFSETGNRSFDRHMRKISRINELYDFFTTGEFKKLKVIENEPKEQETEKDIEDTKLEDCFTIKDATTLHEMQDLETLYLSQGYTKVILEEGYFVHILEISSEILRIEHGPTTIFVSPTELIIVGPKTRDVVEKGPEMSEEDQLENLKLIGRVIDFESPNISEPLGDVLLEDPIINEPEPVAVPKVTIKEPKKEISKKSQKKPVINYDDDDDCFDDDWFSETSSQISYAESYHSVGEYYDNDEHYVVLEMAQDIPVEILEGPPSMYETKPYIFEDEEIEFGEEDLSVPELRQLKDLFESGFITNAEYLTRKNQYLCSK